MTSAWLREKTCGTKVPYLSRQLAENKLFLLDLIGQASLATWNAYHCPFCLDWHLGHKNPSYFPDLEVTP